MITSHVMYTIYLYSTLDHQFSMYDKNIDFVNYSQFNCGMYNNDAYVVKLAKLMSNFTHSR